MAGMLYQYLPGDHDRMDALLTSAVAKAGEIDMAPYSEELAGAESDRRTRDVSPLRAALTPMRPVN